MRFPRQQTLVLAWTLAVVAAIAAVGSGAFARQLPTPVRGGDTLSADIAEDGDVDEFEIWLNTGDTLSAAMKASGPVKGLLGSLSVKDPTGATAVPPAVTVKGQAGKAPKLTFTATMSGLHVVTVAGATGPSNGHATAQLR